MQGNVSNRIGVDVGGTFTDLIFVDEESGEVRVGKDLSPPEAPERAVLTAVDAVVGEKLRECRYFLHGTTVGLNALLERKGAKVGLLATKGFRDVLEKRRSNDDEAWNPVWKPEAPLVPRRHRLPVRGRIAADGSVVEPLSADDVALQTLGKKTRVKVSRGATLEIRTGGGDHGSPSERDPQEVLDDVRDGSISEAAARTHHPHAFEAGA